MVRLKTPKAPCGAESATIAGERLAGLRASARGLPNAAGVYRFFDCAGDLLYVGKARSLRKRVASYFASSASLAPRTSLMVARIRRVEITLTPTEGDALILENDQIKTLKPEFNVLFRDDKSYPYLRLSGGSYPRLLFYRGPPDGDCYGPFSSSWAVRESMRVLQRTFRLRTCSDRNFKNRSRPCLLHQIGRCSAPCVGKIAAADYAADVATARRFLNGQATAVTVELGQRMEAAAEVQDYERAAALRDSINALAEVRHRSVVAGGAVNADFIGLHCGVHGSMVHLAAVRGGRLVAEIDYFPDNAELSSPSGLIAAFVAQHYGRHRPPARVVLRCPHKPTALALLAHAPKTKFIVVPRGDDRERILLCERSAAAALARRCQAGAASTTRLKRLADRLGLDQLDHMECFDVSHCMGEAAMAACVVCVEGLMDKSRYRRYRLRLTAAGDDYAGIREALARRYRNASADPAALPDMIVVDGGAGQVVVARETLSALGAPDQAILGIAKGAGRRPGTETLLDRDRRVIELAPTDPAFHLLQLMRDEAHRFALAGQRRRRDKARRSSVLDVVDGIGLTRRRALLHSFGGLAGLRRASIRDLTKVAGIGVELAERIYRTVHC